MVRYPSRAACLAMGTDPTTSMHMRTGRLRCKARI
jgi:hypothetical protein